MDSVLLVNDLLETGGRSHGAAGEILVVRLGEWTRQGDSHLRGNAVFQLRGEKGRRVGDGLIGVIDVVDEKLATRAFAVIETKAVGFRISSKDGELGLHAGRADDYQRDGINVRLHHPSKDFTPASTDYSHTTTSRQKNSAG